MTLKFNRVRALVKEHVRAKYQAECSGLCVIVLTDKKKRPTKTIQSVATARTVTSEHE